MKSSFYASYLPGLEGPLKLLLGQRRGGYNHLPLAGTGVRPESRSISRAKSFPAMAGWNASSTPERATTCAGEPSSPLATTGVTTTRTAALGGTSTDGKTPGLNETACSLAGRSRRRHPGGGHHQVLPRRARPTCREAVRQLTVPPQLVLIRRVPRGGGGATPPRGCLDDTIWQLRSAE